MDKYAELGELLFGGGADELVHKLSPEQKQKSKEAERKIGYGLNAASVVAGPAAMYSAARSAKNNQGGIPRDIAGAAASNKKFARTKIGSKVRRGVDYVGAGFNQGATKGQRRAAIASGTGLVGLQVANWGGDIIATRALKKPEEKKVAKRLVPVSKAEPTSSDIHIPNVGTLKRKAGKKAWEKSKPHIEATAGNAKAKVLSGAPEVGGKVKQYTKEKIGKSITWEGEISKVNEEKRQVFGWASIVEVDGEPVVDLQGDYIDIDEVEKSAYEYVIKSRKGGDMHRRIGDEPFHAADMIESFIVTPEKKEKMGLPDSVPTGWWVGYKINDDEAWNLVKSGKRTGFSIHGRGQRTPMEL